MAISEGGSCIGREERAGGVQGLSPGTDMFQSLAGVPPSGSLAMAIDRIEVHTLGMGEPGGSAASAAGSKNEPGAAEEESVTGAEPGGDERNAAAANASSALSTL